MRKTSWAILDHWLLDYATNKWHLFLFISKRKNKTRKKKKNGETRAKKSWAKKLDDEIKIEKSPSALLLKVFCPAQRRVVRSVLGWEKKKNEEGLWQKATHRAHSAELLLLLFVQTAENKKEKIYIFFFLGVFLSNVVELDPLPFHFLKHSFEIFKWNVLFLFRSAPFPPFQIIFLVHLLFEFQSKK